MTNLIELPLSLPLVCQAIKQHVCLEVDFGGRRRILEPYCHGVSTAGTEVVRAVQVGDGFGKLWTVSEMSRLALSEEHFEPNDPRYNPDDSAMKRVICRID